MRLHLSVVEPSELVTGGEEGIEGRSDTLAGREAFIHCDPGTHLGPFGLDEVLVRPSSEASSLDGIRFGPVNLVCVGFRSGNRCVDFTAIGEVVGH